MNNDRKEPIVADLRTVAARQARKSFVRRLKEQKERERLIAFNILVWGMSPEKNDPIAKKRNDIREQLIEDGHNAMFSEELTSVSGGIGLSEKSTEFAQANAADLVIVLIEDSPGALAEACDFCNHSDLAPKIYVMAPDAYKTGYAGQGALKELDEGYGGVYWYQVGEVEACNLLTQANNRVQARRSMAYRHRVKDSD